MRRYFFILLSLSLMFWSTVAEAGSMADYTSYPINITQAVTPNVLFMFSNDHTNFYAGYNDFENYDNSTDYYGYFNPDDCYTYNGSYFEPASFTGDHTCSGQWSGNFLNWLTMCHADFVRKALTGGKRSTDTTSPLLTILERGDIPTDDHRWTKDPNVSISAYTPYSDDNYTFYNTGITLEVKDGGGSTVGTFNVRVKVCDPNFGCEDNCNPDTYKPEGLIQRFSSRIRFGLMSYSYDRTEQGGVLRDNVDSDIDDLIYFINNFTKKGWDPTAEMFYEGIKYFKNLSYTSDYRPDNNDGFDIPDWEDPVQYYCQKNFIIIVNDEYPSKDHDTFPGGVWDGNDLDNIKEWTNKVGDLEGITGTAQSVGRYEGSDVGCGSTEVIEKLGEVDGICPLESGARGTFHIAGLAYYANTTDLRDLEGDQTISTYSIAFRASPSGYEIPPPPMNQLWLAAKYGGFNDENENNIPDLQEEWDENGDGIPDNFAYAEGGSEFEDALMGAINAVLKRVSSSTAASVLSTTGEAQGVVLQAYFNPVDEDTEAEWLGYLKALWVDPWGNIREDSNGNDRLDMGDHLDAGDLIIQFVLDDNNTVTVYKYHDGGDCDPGIENCADGIRDNCKDLGCYPGKPGCSECEADADTSLDDLLPIWEAGKELALREASGRVIKTWVDIDGDEVVDSNEFIDFNTLNASVLRPYLGVGTVEEAEKVIEFIRGNEVEGYRNRNVYVNGTEMVWKLGDIVNSTPTLVGRPAERMDVLYSDITYGDFFKAKRDRNIMIYTGANDGMFHAFNGGKVNKDAFTGGGGCAPTDGDELGGEKWAYIPQHLLPHLRWLTDPEYTHVNYVDAKPRITDARIFASTGVVGTHPQGWGTILVGGMRFGGGKIMLTDDFGNGTETRTFRPSYFCMDITNPTNNPTYENLLWEKTHENLGFTTSYPWFVRVSDDPAISDTGDWSTIFGSGPTTYEGSSDQNARLFVLDLKTGSFTEELVSEKPNGFMGGPFTIDFNYFGESQNPYVDGDYSDDMIYVGETYGTDVLDTCVPGNGRMLRISTRGGNVNPWTFNYETDPANWVMRPLTDKFRITEDLLPPVTATGNATLDEELNLWVFFGTGRFYNECDKSDTTPQYFFNVIDDYWDYGVSDTGVSDGSDANNGDDWPTNLFTWQNVSAFEVTDAGAIKDNAMTFVDIKNLLKTLKGWFVEVGFGENSGERVLTTPHILGGAILFPSFKPEAGVCNYGGESFLNALYYETGTAYTKKIIGTEEKDGVIINKKTQDLDKGMSSAISLHQADRAFIQQSSGLIHQLEIDLPFDVKSGIRGWHQP